MNESILSSVKKVLNIPVDYPAFDQDIIMHINSTFSTLHQLGIGPVDGFMIEDATPTWDTFTTVAAGQVNYSLTSGAGLTAGVTYEYAVAAQDCSPAESNMLVSAATLVN